MGNPFAIVQIGPSRIDKSATHLQTKKDVRKRREDSCGREMSLRLHWSCCQRVNRFGGRYSELSERLNSKSVNAIR